MVSYARDCHSRPDIRATRHCSSIRVTANLETAAISGWNACGCAASGPSASTPRSQTVAGKIRLFVYDLLPAWSRPSMPWRLPHDAEVAGAETVAVALERRLAE